MLTEIEHVENMRHLRDIPPRWRVIVYVSPDQRSGILIGKYWYLRSARRAARKTTWKGEWEIEVENYGCGPFWIPWENKNGRIEWPPSK